MRERPVIQCSDGNTHGITPARAGKTLNDDGRCPWAEDHPRSCGKDFMIFRFFRCHRGSPPLVRERQLGTDRDDVVGGITPARAGKTKGSPGRQQCAEDHPRSCGKDIGIISIISMALGSPPLVRERPWQDDFRALVLRITPARAGKTYSSYALSVTTRDHPRSCGKDGQIAHKLYVVQGSPPLVRERHEKDRYNSRG